MAEYKFQIVNKHVHIPESYVAQLGRIYAGYYLFLIEQTGYPASVNLPLVRYIVKSESWLIFVTQYHTVAKQYWTRLAPLFTDPTSILVCFRVLWEEMVETYRFYKDEGNHFLTRFRHVFFSPVWRPIIFHANLWYIIQTIWEQNANEEEFRAQNMHPDLRFKEEWSRERFQDMLYEMTVHHQTKLKERIQPFKEELIAAAMHPRRVERLINEYGIDVLDML
jgi:hypothetical protein